MQMFFYCVTYKADTRVGMFSGYHFLSLDQAQRSLHTSYMASMR